MSEQPVGDRIDAAGVVLDLNDGDLVSDYLVVAKVITADGTVGIALGNNDGMDWVSQLGLIEAARQIVKYGTEGDE